MAAEPSPLPWAVTVNPMRRDGVFITHGQADRHYHGELPAAVIPCQVDYANAALIVLAVNSHAALVEAARMVLHGFGAGVFVHTTEGDDAADWAVTAMPYISALATLEVTLRQMQAQAEGRE